jgi:hypothetical protein
VLGTKSMLPSVLLLCLTLIGCEPEERRMTRLDYERDIACEPFARADSVREARALAEARIENGSVTDPVEVKANLEEASRDLSDQQRRTALTPTQAKHEEDSANAARLTCERAERALSRFMAGRRER